MSGTTMIVLIVLISVGSGVIYDMYKKHLEFKHKVQVNNLDAHKQLAEVTAQVTELKQRVQTLEAIVTDSSYSVKQEINKL
jgi:ABC-type lipoprotein release transport system permease subunit